MSFVALVSGGLDSTLMCALAREEGREVYPLFIDYGQIACERELAACKAAMAAADLPKPTVMDLSGFGRTIPCGLTSADYDVFLDAFLPGRNLLFLLAGAARAYSLGLDAVAIGLLSEDSALFRDQERVFVDQTQALLEHLLERPMPVLAPLMGMSKADVVALANRRGIDGAWSCHLAGCEPCGHCIACREYLGVES